SLVYNDVALFGALVIIVAGQIPHGLGIAFDGGQRRAQVVADVGQNIFLQLSAALDFGGHVVEILRQLADLVPVYDLDLYVVVAGGDLPGPYRKLFHRAGEPAAEQHGKQQIKDQQHQRQGEEDRAHDLRSGGDLRQTGRDDHPVLPVGGKPAYQHLLAAARLHDFKQVTLLEQLLAHLNDER